MAALSEREALARIVDPLAFTADYAGNRALHDPTFEDRFVAGRVKRASKALRKADAIIARYGHPAAVTDKMLTEAYGAWVNAGMGGKRGPERLRLALEAAMSEGRMTFPATSTLSAGPLQGQRKGGPGNAKTSIQGDEPNG